MASIGWSYRDQVTSQSRKELIKFARWMKRNHNVWPTVIGGWAVWVHFPDGYGSRDVDLVMPSDEWIVKNMEKDYFPNNGFRVYEHMNLNWVERHHGKPINPAKPDIDIIRFDLMSASRPRADPEEIGVVVDWNWANEFGIETRLNTDAHIIIPEVELLVTLKIIGALARKKALLAVRERTYLAGKIWKDYIDIANLTAHVRIDARKLKMHFTRSKLTRLLWQEFLDGYIGLPDVLEETKTTIPEIEGSLKVNWKK